MKGRLKRWLVFGGESRISKITSSEFYEKVDNLTDFPTSQSSNQRSK